MDYGLASSQTHPFLDGLASFVNWRTWAREDVPETKGLVPRPCHDGAAIRVHGQVQHTMRVTDQRGNSLQLGIGPYIDLVLRVAMGADDLMRTPAEGQVADLRSCVSFSHYLVCQHVSEAEDAIRSASSCC